MGNLPSTISCPDGGGFYSVDSRVFSSACSYDTTGPTLNIIDSTLYDCITSCAANRQCKAISYTGTTCYQKSAIGRLVASDHVSSFTDFNAPPEELCPNYDGQNRDGFTIQCGIDYPGIGDMGSTQEASFANCMSTCSATQNCVAVAYSGNACYLKNKIGAPVTNAAVSGAVLATLPPYVPDTPPASTGLSCPAADGSTIDGFLIACEQDYPGGDLSSLHTDTFSDCIAACASNDDCVDVAYNHGSCYLKNILTTLQPSGGVWNAKRLNPPVRTPDPAETPSCPSDDGTLYHSGDQAFSVHCYSDYAGGDYKSLATDKFSECLAACADEDECVDVAWNHGSCYLKSTLTSAVDNPNVWGAIKIVTAAQSLNTASNPSNTTVQVEVVRRRTVRRSAR